MMEVKTVRGWMAVGTNCNWIGLQDDGLLLDIFMMRDRIRGDSLHLKKQWNAGIPFWDDIKHKGSYRIVYGLYSRHGQFLTSNPLEKWMHNVGLRSPFPDYNLRELLYNF